MKRRNILTMLLIFLAGIGASIQTASAAALGDAWSVGGVGFGWILIGLVVAVAVIAMAFQVSKAAMKPFVPILAILLIAGLALQFVDVAAEPAEITPATIWSVSTSVDSATNQTTVDDDARTITILCKVNSTAETMNNTWDSGGTGEGFVNPIINFTIAPSQTEGIISTDLAATTLASVNNPDQDFTEDGATHDLFADASGENKKDVNWTADDTEDYETHYCVVNFGSSETVLLTIVFQEDGISTLDIGESESFTITIGGITYTVTLTVIGVMT